MYYRFSQFLKQRYGEKVYKLPINISNTCPNRDGNLSMQGCSFCGEEGAGFEMLSNKLSVREQLIQNAEIIGDGYKAKKFIVYFQNFSNTYMPIEAFKEMVLQSVFNGVVAVYISTRPDCLDLERVDFLKSFQEQTGLDVVLELGLQSVNHNTLRFLNRGHSLAEFINAVGI